jgi:hypothetical protein
MMTLFKGDPQAALDKTRAKLSSVEDNISSLKAKRAETLLAAEDAGAVVTIDKAIEAESANAVICQDRIKALQEECRRNEYASREAKRKQAIGKISAALKRREQIASDLQAAIERVGELYAQLTERDEVEMAWPFPLRGGGLTLDLHGVHKEISWALHGLIHGCRLPPPSSAGLGVSGITAQGIDGVVRQQNGAIISRLEVTPIAADLLEEAI